MTENPEIQSGATPVLENAPVESREKSRVAGTLVYTTAGLVVLFSWLLWGDFAWSMKERAAGPIVQVLLKRFEASDFLYAMLTVSVPAAINIFLAPIISFRSDRHRGRWGRRMPYLIITTPIAGLALVGVAFSPKFGGAAHGALGSLHLSQNVFILCFLGTFWTIFEIATLSANGVFGGLINDVVPRPLLGRFYGLFRALSLIAGIIFNFWLFDQARVHYVWVFIAVSLLYGVGFLSMCLKVKEGEYPPPPPADLSQTMKRRFADAFCIFFRECFSNPYYIWIFIGWTFSNLTFIPVNTFAIPYADAIGAGHLYGRLLALTYLISLALSYPLGHVCDRHHPLRVSILMLVLYAGCCAWGGLCIRGTVSFSIALVAHGVISGAFFTTSASLGQKLYPHSRFAQFNSAATMMMALSQIILGFTLGRYLDWTHHNYRLTYVVGGILSVLGAVALLAVQRMFVQLGGDRDYVAPE